MDIDRIEVEISGLNPVDVVVFPKENKCIINGVEKMLPEYQINALLRIFIYWKSEYGSLNIIDAEEFNINIISSGNTSTYHGKGIFPNNYNELRKWIGDIK